MEVYNSDEYITSQTVAGVNLRYTSNKSNSQKNVISIFAEFVRQRITVF